MQVYMKYPLPPPPQGKKRVGGGGKKKKSERKKENEQQRNELLLNHRHVKFWGDHYSSANENGVVGWFFVCFLPRGEGGSAAYSLSHSAPLPLPPPPTLTQAAPFLPLPQRPSRNNAVAAINGQKIGGHRQIQLTQRGGSSFAEYWLCTAVQALLAADQPWGGELLHASDSMLRDGQGRRRAG